MTIASHEVTASESGHLSDSSSGFYHVWADCYGAATGIPVENSATLQVAAWKDSSNHFRISRGRLRWDLTSLAGASIASASLFIRLFEKTVEYGSNRKIYAVDGDDLGNNMVVGDYGTIKGNTTLVSDTVADMTSYSVGDWVEFALNAAGLARLLTTDYTMLCLRSYGDYNNTAPLQSNTELLMKFYGSKSISLPYLSITYYTNKYPSDAIARVSSIRHICLPGSYRMQVGLGDIGFDVDISETAVRTALETAKETAPWGAEMFTFNRPTAPPPKVEGSMIPPLIEGFGEKFQPDVRKDYP